MVHPIATERGECSFVSKAIKAMEAGAIAAVITDNDVENDEMYVAMQGRTAGLQDAIEKTILALTDLQSFPSHHAERFFGLFSGSSPALLGL